MATVEIGIEQRFSSYGGKITMKNQNHKAIEEEGYYLIVKIATEYVNELLTMYLGSELGIIRARKRP